MAQVASPQSGMMGRLPEIQHPLSRLENPADMELRGVSRAGSRLRTSSGRPLAAENDGPGYPLPRSRLSTRHSRTSIGRRSMQEHNLNVDTIPEGVEVMAGDPNKTRLPIFGSRAEFNGAPPMSAAPGGRVSRASTAGGYGGGQDLGRIPSRLSTASAQQRLEIDQLEMGLREKIKSGYYEIKKRFKDNDPEQKGNVSRDAFFRILVTVMGRPVNTSQYSRLMERLGFKDKQVISFPEFFSQFREVGESTEYPRWMDPVQRQVQERAVMSASQVHALLKDKAKQRVTDLADLVPQINPDGSGRILKPEFRNVLNRLGFYMEDVEFDKLWEKYDPEHYGTINGEKMMQKLGISFHADGSIVNGGGPGTPDSAMMSSGGRPLKKKEIERQRSLNIERWLKSKFREGFSQMKLAFEERDVTKCGLVSHADFLSILSKYGLKLDKAHLADFLARCNVSPTNKDVPYREFLHRFQDRSESGMPHTILTNPKHPYNRAESPGGKSTMSSLETQMMNMFQRDFLTLLGTFHKIDKLGMDMISQEEFRAAIESRFMLDMTEDQFANLIDRVPLDEEGNVKYADFMAQFDTRGKARSLFDGASAYQSAPPYKSVGALPRDPSPPLPQPIMEEDEPMQQDIQLSQEEVDQLADMEFGRRSGHDLFTVIKDLLKRRYQDVEESFHVMDEMNTGRLSQETMFELLKRFDIKPEITRGEIRDLWKTFITNTDKTLNFNQFTRHFGYSLRSAAFPNAKVIPPRRGDSDFMVRSRKLNCAADMLQDSLRSKIDYMWEELRREFTAMDPYGTGFVSSEEFYDVLSELCVHLNPFELDMLAKKFDNKNDGRVSYIEFLKPFALRKQGWRHGNNMMSLLQHPNAGLPIADIVEPPQKGLTGISAKLRNKLSGDWKNLRRAFRKLDPNNNGYLGVPEFRSVLQLANVVLDEDEVYHVMSQFDEDMTGKIAYNKFLNDTFKPSSSSSRMLNSSLRRSADI